MTTFIRATKRRLLLAVLASVGCTIDGTDSDLTNSPIPQPIAERRSTESGDAPTEAPTSSVTLAEFGNRELRYDQQLVLIEDLEFRLLCLPSAPAARKEAEREAETSGLLAWGPMKYDASIARFARDLHDARSVITFVDLQARLNEIVARSSH